MLLLKILGPNVRGDEIATVEVFSDVTYYKTERCAGGDAPTFISFRVGGVEELVTREVEGVAFLMNDHGDTIERINA